MLIAPCHAGELDAIGPSTQFYVRIPLGVSAPKDRVPSYGMAIRGRHDYQVFTLDSRMLDAFSFDGGLIAGVIEAKWLLVGGAAVVGAVAVARSGGGGPAGAPAKQGTPPPTQQGTPPPAQQGTPPPAQQGTPPSTQQGTPPAPPPCPQTRPSKAS